MTRGGGLVEKTLSQKVAEAIFQKSVSYIPLKAGETPQDNPFLPKQRVRPVKSNSKEPGKATHE